MSHSSPQHERMYTPINWQVLQRLAQLESLFLNGEFNPVASAAIDRLTAQLERGGAA